MKPKRLLAATIGVTLCAAGALSTTHARSSDPATQALAYLAGQQSSSDGSVDGSVAETCQYAIAAAVAGEDPNILRHGAGPSVVQYLEHDAATDKNAANQGLLVEVALASGLDPKTFGGVNLVSKIASQLNVTTGGYGAGDTFTQAFAMFGLEADHQTVPASAIAYLKSAQGTDGGWDFSAIKDDITNPFDTSDTNSTAMALMALNGAGDHTLDAGALHPWLASQQVSSGGFAYQMFPGATSDPDSDALVMQALISTGQNPSGAGWGYLGSASKTVLTDLIAAQDASGGYSYPGSPVNAFTTAQVPLALEHIAYPVDFLGHSYNNPSPSLITPTAVTTTPPTPTATVIGGLTPPITTQPTPKTTPTSTPTASSAPTPQSHVVRRVAHPTAAVNVVTTAQPTATSTAIAPTPTGAVSALTTVGSPPATAVLAAHPSNSWWWLYLLVAIVGFGGSAGFAAMRARRKG